MAAAAAASGRSDCRLLDGGEWPLPLLESLPGGVKFCGFRLSAAQHAGRRHTHTEAKQKQEQTRYRQVDTTTRIDSSNPLATSPQPGKSPETDRPRAVAWLGVDIIVFDHIGMN